MQYTVVTSSEFRTNQAKYLNMANEGHTIFIKRGGGFVYRLGVPSKLPDSFERRIEKPKLCQHHKERGECMAVWCKHNPNNI